MKENKFIYLYEDSFEELLYIFDYLIKRNLTPLDIVKEKDYVPNLLDPTIFLKKETKENMQNKYLNKTSKKIMFVIKDIYLSNACHKELISYYFLRNALKYQETIFYRKNLKCVNMALNISHYVRRETHKMKGFLRFQEIQNHILYAKMAPENNIIFALANHFKERLKNEIWIIHDVKRHIYAIYKENKIYFLQEEKNPIIKMTDEEKEIEHLWKSFFQAVGIEERENKRCQMSFMPKKYWRYLIEMEDENENNCNWKNVN